MKIVTCILARGGSKGIPRKNIIDLNGKPLLSYTIGASINSNVNETWVSTEDAEIKKVALSYGAQVIDRPKELAEDFSRNEDSLLDFANHVDFDILVMIQATSPLLTAKYINIGLSKMLTGQYDSVFSVCREHWVPRWTLDIQPVSWSPYHRHHRQEVPEQFIENGAFYITSREALLESKLRYSGKMDVVEMPFSESLQVDNLDELKVISKLLK